MQHAPPRDRPGQGWFGLWTRATGDLVGEVVLQRAPWGESVVEIGWHVIVPSASDRAVDISTSWSAGPERDGHDLLAIAVDDVAGAGGAQGAHGNAGLFDGGDEAARHGDLLVGGRLKLWEG